nr:uncharacterized mitochondrial protein AtMg00810-like [Tanacetum cinerariifolium]
MWHLYKPVQIRVRNPEKYGMDSCNPVGTLMEIKDKLDLDQNGTPGNATKYRSMIGALTYLTSSRPDIVHATCLCDRYQAKTTEKHLKEVRRIFHYLWGTINMGLWYMKDSGFELTRFLDADYAGCKDTFKSTSSAAQFLGEKMVSWSLKKQDCTALSTAEVEYVSLSACCTQVLWMRTQLTDYGFYFNKTPIYCDSKSAIAISFFTQPLNTLNAPVDKKDSNFDEILDDWFRVGAEKLRQMGEEKVQNGCNVDTSRDTNHESDNLLNFPIFPATNKFSSIYITVEDVERIRKFLAPNIPNEMDEEIQPLIPQPIHITPPNDDYVAPATKLILDELLEEFRDEIVNATMVDGEADSNPTRDIEELERLFVKDPQSYFT